MAKRKRLYKSNNGKIFGVCKGIAEYFDIDPTLVRLAWLALSCVYGSGILIYIISAIIMPSEDEVKRDEIKEAKIKK